MRLVVFGGSIDDSSVGEPCGLSIQLIQAALTAHLGKPVEARYVRAFPAANLPQRVGRTVEALILTRSSSTAREHTLAYIRARSTRYQATNRCGVFAHGVCYPEIGPALEAAQHSAVPLCERPRRRGWHPVE